MVTTGIKGFKDSPMVPLKTDGPNSTWLSLPGSTRNKSTLLLPPLSQYLPISKPKDSQEKIVTFTMVDLHYIHNGKQIHITFAEYNACEFLHCKIQC